jgi:threonine dehydrogenase-like Zn-dependent dehydrogenase
LTPGTDGGTPAEREVRLRRSPVGEGTAVTMRLEPQPADATAATPSFLMTHRMTLEDGAEGYDLFKNKKDGCLRVVFAP